MSTQRNRQLNRYVSKVIECLEQNIRKQIDSKRPSNSKQMNRLQKIFKLKYGNTKLLGNIHIAPCDNYISWIKISVDSCHYMITHAVTHT